jgi:hypothetical protein
MSCQPRKNILKLTIVYHCLRLDWSLCGRFLFASCPWQVWDLLFPVYSSLTDWLSDICGSMRHETDMRWTSYIAEFPEEFSLTSDVCRISSVLFHAFTFSFYQRIVPVSPCLGHVRCLLIFCCNHCYVCFNHSTNMGRSSVCAGGTMCQNIPRKPAHIREGSYVMGICLQM